MEMSHFPNEKKHKFEVTQVALGGLFIVFFPFYFKAQQTPKGIRTIIHKGTKFLKVPIWVNSRKLAAFLNCGSTPKKPANFRWTFFEATIFSGIFGRIRMWTAYVDTL